MIKRVEFDEIKILIDPWLNGDLTFPPGDWLIKGELAKEIEDFDFQATALTNISIHELNFNKNYEKSLRGLNEVLDIYTKLGKKQGLEFVCH